MKKIGGFFSYEKVDASENHFFDRLCPSDGDLKFLMSGRCAIYYALEDINRSDRKKVAYVPLYTCETVLAPFEKAGYELLFYDFDINMTPIFDDGVLDQISVISICGYYGFSLYDKSFIKRCHDYGIIVIEDTTHSIFSGDGIDPFCDYVVGSLRKWIGVASGGFAIKMKGKFSLPLLEANNIHLSMRASAMKTKQKFETFPDSYDRKELDDAMAIFWDAEMMLRRIFDRYASDFESIHIMNHVNFDTLKARRRENYQYLLDHMTPCESLTIVFAQLPSQVVPSHFTLFAKKRDHVQKVLKEQGISSTIYWPKGPLIDLTGHPNACYIYDHVLSIPCDQRYGIEDMAYICKTLRLTQE